jgi:hypothetical protein
MATHGIYKGSAWLDGEGRHVTVEDAKVGHIAFRVAGQPIGPAIRHNLFREIFRRNVERQVIRSRFTMSLANLAQMHVYFDPEKRCIYARSTDRSTEGARRASRGAPEVPSSALYIGTYDYPAPFEDFESDLVDVLDRNGLERLR